MPFTSPSARCQGQRFRAVGPALPGKARAWRDAISPSYPAGGWVTTGSIQTTVQMLPFSDLDDLLPDLIRS